MFVSTTTRSGRVASQYKFKSLIEKVNENDENSDSGANVTNRHDKVKKALSRTRRQTASITDKSRVKLALNPNKKIVENDSGANVTNRHDKVKKALTRTRHQTASITNKSRVRLALNPSKKIAGNDFRKVVRKTHLSSQSSIKKLIKVNENDENSDSGANVTNQHDKVKKALTRTRRQTASITNKSRVRLALNPNKKIVENDSGANVTNRHDKVKKALTRTRRQTASITNKSRVRLALNPSKKIAENDFRKVVRKTSLSSRVRRKKLPTTNTPIVGQRSVYVICERNLTAQNTDIPKKVVFSPTCILTHDSAVEEVVKKLTEESGENNEAIKGVGLGKKNGLRWGKYGVWQKKKLDQSLGEQKIEGGDVVVDAVDGNNARGDCVNVDFALDGKQVDENKIENEKERTNNRRKDKNDNIDKRLRFRKTKDYNEITQNSINLTVVEKVDRRPIYKNKLLSPVKRRKDVYEFREDVNKPASEEEEFEKGTASLIKELERQFNKKVEGDKKKPKKRKIGKNEKALKKVQVVKDNKNTKIKDMQIGAEDDEVELIGRRCSISSDNARSSPCPSESLQLFDSPSPSHASSTPLRILSNILVNDSIYFKKPNANSTMFIQRSPWRPTLALRTPLFLTTKKSSLPTYDQDLIIDHKMQEKTCSTPIRNHAQADRKKTKQDSILNYVNSSMPIESPRDEFNYSLFDADQLSPVKTARSPLKDCTNILPSKGKRNLPSDRENLPPVKHLPSPANSFSFLGGETVSPVKQGKPTRLSVGEVKRVIFGGAKVVRKVEPRPVEEVVNATEENVEAEERDGVPIVGLFEDFEMEKVPPKVTYGRFKGKTKRQRYASINDGSEDETVAHAKKKRKDVRSKEEELEAEKWAEKFNQMCKEVDQYQLAME